MIRQAWKPSSSCTGTPLRRASRLMSAFSTVAFAMPWPRTARNFVSSLPKGMPGSSRGRRKLSMMCRAVVVVSGR